MLDCLSVDYKRYFLPLLVTLSLLKLNYAHYLGLHFMISSFRIKASKEKVMEGFKARDIGIRAQKKILSRMATKNVAKVFIDDTSASLLDNVYKLARAYTGNKKEAEKLVKNIIKIVIKVAVLYRNNQFNSEEMKHAERFKSKFHSAAMAVISFYEVDFSYDRMYLLKHIKECSASLLSLVQHHLTGKSIARISHVFDFFLNPQFLDAIFKKDNEYNEILGKIVADMNKALDTGDL